MKPGSRWRFKVGDISCHTHEGPLHIQAPEKYGEIFDELVVDDWLHVEQMSRHVWLIQVGDHTLAVTVGGKGEATQVAHYGPGEC